MTKKEIRKAHVIRSYMERRMTRKQAAEALALTERQITRLTKGMRENGEESLIHKNIGRKPKHAITEEQAAEIRAIRKREEYEGCNIRHFMRLLEQRHDIKISYKPLYTILTKAGMSSPMKQREQKGKHHRSRKRKSQAGELLQIDATPYEWFGGEEKSTLHAAIDDASGRITGAYITSNECLHGYYEVMKQTCEREGVPLSVYSDKHTIFRSPKTEAAEAKGETPTLTQFGRALDELGINIIHAHSPQAKGRVERLWVTLQSRLPVELRIRGITTVEDANTFLISEYIAAFNAEFGVTPTEGSLFVPYRDTVSLTDIFCVKHTRKMDNAGVFTFNGLSFCVQDEGYPLIPAKATVTVMAVINGGVRVQYKGRIFNTVVCQKAKSTRKPKRTSTDLQAEVTPHLRHGSDEWKKLWHFEDYEETLAFLYALFFKPCA